MTATDPLVTPLTIRKFRVDLRDRVRVAAAHRQVSMETIINEAVSLGLIAIEHGLPLLTRRGSPYEEAC